MIHPAAGNAQALVEGKRDGADGLSSRVKVAEGKQTVGGKVIESQADRRRNIRRHGGNTHRNDGGRIHGGGRRSLGSGNRVLDIILVRGIVTATGERAGGRENKELIGTSARKEAVLPPSAMATAYFFPSVTDCTFSDPGVLRARTFTSSPSCQNTGYPEPSAVPKTALVPADCRVT